MEKLMAQVREFMVAAGQRIGREPGDIHTKEAHLGAALVTEEYRELMDALQKQPKSVAEIENSLVEIADALGDLLYVVTWTGLAFGFPMVEIMDEIQRANMAKFGPGSMKDPTSGKQLKPPDWQPPDLKKVMGLR